MRTGAFIGTWLIAHCSPLLSHHIRVSMPYHKPYHAGGRHQYEVVYTKFCSLYNFLRWTTVRFLSFCPNDYRDSIKNWTVSQYHQSLLMQLFVSWSEGLIYDEYKYWACPKHHNTNLYSSCSSIKRSKASFKSCNGYLLFVSQLFYLSCKVLRYLYFYSLHNFSHRYHLGE